MMLHGNGRVILIRDVESECQLCGEIGRSKKVVPIENGEVISEAEYTCNGEHADGYTHVCEQCYKEWDYKNELLQELRQD